MASFTSGKMMSTRRQPVLAPAATLARWQLRRVWRLLLLTCVGMIAAVVLACSIPLYSWVTLTAGLRGIFTTSPTNSYIGVHNASLVPSSDATADATKQLRDLTNPQLAYYVGTSPLLVVTTSAYDFRAPANDSLSSKEVNKLELGGFDMSQVSSRVKLLRGNLPQSRPDGLEIVLLEKTAAYFHVDVGSTITLNVPYIASKVGSRYNDTYNLPLKLKVSGIVQVKDQFDAFWHNFTLTVDAGRSSLLFKALTSGVDIPRAFEVIKNPADQVRNASLLNPHYYSWYYQVDVSRVDANRVEELADGIDTFADDTEQLFSSPPNFNEAKISSPRIELGQYRDHMAIAELPSVILSVLVVGLVVFFVSLMADLLVERQSAAVAILRSRGASRNQIFSALLIQCLILALLALILGPLLAFPTVIVLIQRTLVDGQDALTLLTAHPLDALWQVRWLIIGTVVAAAIAMTLATYRATNLDVLSLRRDASRNVRPPFWMRLYLDVLAIIVALVCYGISNYVINAGLLDAKTRVLLQGPLILVSSLSLLLAGALLFLRIFPSLLRLGLRLATRGRGIIPVLGLGMMARAPQQALRMILLLTFALAFVVFSLIFSTSQVQHMYDVAVYQGGADFSGTITASSISSGSASDMLAGTIKAYQHIPGVRAATVGRITYAYPSSAGADSAATPYKLLAIDPKTFVAATSWGSRDDAQSLQGLVDQLAKVRARAARPDLPLPALVDAKTATLQHVQVGSVFKLFGPTGFVHFVVVGVVPPIPSVNDNAGAGLGEPGLVVDYLSFDAASAALASADPASTSDGSAPSAPSYAWLRTTDDPQQLKALRQQLQSGDLRLGSLKDRRALLVDMEHDPLYRNFVGVLALGALAPILLALVGNLLISWWNARKRVSNFVVLRAIGTDPRQLGGVLLCEQGIIYLTALVLGILFGLVLATLTLPALVFTNVSPGKTLLGEGGVANVFTIQNVPPVQLVVPLWLLLILVALAVVCTLALGTMIRTVTRPSISQTLRVNED